MRWSILAVLLLCDVAALGQPSPPSDPDRRQLQGILDRIKGKRDADENGPHSVMMDLEAKVGLRDAKGNYLRPRMPDPNYQVVTPEVIEDYLKRLRKFDKDVAEAFRMIPENDREAYALAAQQHKQFQEELKPLCDQAIQAALKAYQIEPVRKTGIISNGPPPPKTRDDFPSFWGFEATWNPVFRESVDPKDWGFTDPNGHSGIGRLEVFEDAARLGWVLYHESKHFEDLLDSDQEIKNAPSAEIRHRTEAEQYIGSVFALSAEDISDNESKIREYQRKELGWDQLMKRGFDPYKKSQRWKFGEIKAFARFEGRDLTLPEIVEADASEGALGEDLERIRDGRERDFLHSFARDALPIAAEAKRLADSAAELHRAQEQAERERRRQEAEERERRQLVDIQARRTAAEACGFEEVFRTWGDKSSYGFRSGPYDAFYYQDEARLDTDEAKAAFMLARACMQQTGGSSATDNGPVGAPCNDALDGMRRKWSDAGFRYSLIVGPQAHWTREPSSYMSPATYCVHYVVAKMEAPVSMEKIRSVMQDFRKHAQEEERRRQRQRASPAPGRSGGGEDEGQTRGGEERRDRPPGDCRYDGIPGKAGCRPPSL